MDRESILYELKLEKENYIYMAECLTYEHQKSLKLDLLRKVDSIQYQIDELEKKDK